VKKVLAIPVIVLTLGLALWAFWAASAQDTATRPTLAGATPKAKPDQPKLQGADPLDVPANARDSFARNEPTLAPFSPRVPAPARWKNAGSAVEKLGLAYSEAISGAVAAGALNEKEVDNLNREFETLIAIRKARLDVMRAIHVLESVGKDNNTKQGQEAKRLTDALRAALQMEPNPSPGRVLESSVFPPGAAPEPFRPSALALPR